MAPGAPAAGSIENMLESRGRMGARHAREATITCFWSSVPKRKRCKSRTDCSRASEPNPTTLRKARKQGGAVASSQSRSDAGETRSSTKAAGSIGTPTGTAAGINAAPRPLPLPAAAGGGGGPAAAAAPTAGGAAAGATRRGGARARPAIAQKPGRSARKRRVGVSDASRDATRQRPYIEKARVP